jgi:L-malate glycosyltransferase
MKITFLGPISPPFLASFLPFLTEEKINLLGKIGGTGLAPLVIEAINDGHKVEIISLYQSIQDKIIFEEGNVRFICLPSRKKGLGRDLFNQERKLISEHLLTSDSDIINAHWTYEYALAALDTKRKNVVITARDCPRDVLKYSDYHYWAQYLSSRIVYSKSKYITTVSPYVYDYIQKFSKSVVAVIPNAVNEKVFNISKKETPKGTNNNFTIVSSLQWNRLKNAKNAILAYSIFRKKVKNSNYILIGNDLGINQKAQVWAKTNGLDEGINFIGSKSYEDYLKLMQTGDVYFHPSRTEACSMAISDALVLGIPVIGGSNNGGVPWQLQWGLGGILTDVENPDVMSDDLLKVYNNKNDFLKYITGTGSNWANEWLRMEKVFKRYLTVFEKLC